MKYPANIQEKLEQRRRIVTRFYAALSITAVMIMVATAYLTHGYNNREVHVELAGLTVQEEEQSAGIDISADYSRIPEEKVIEKILNKNIPDVCKDCDEDTLDCLDKYEVNKVLVQEQGYQDHLFIELLTGKKNKKKYTVAIDLANNNQVLSKSGEIDKKMCFETEEEDVEAEVYLNRGDDPAQTDYLEVPNPQ